MIKPKKDNTISTECPSKKMDLDVGLEDLMISELTALINVKVNFTILQAIWSPLWSKSKIWVLWVFRLRGGPSVSNWIQKTDPSLLTEALYLIFNGLSSLILSKKKVKTRVITLNLKWLKRQKLRIVLRIVLWKKWIKRLGASSNQTAQRSCMEKWKVLSANQAQMKMTHSEKRTKKKILGHSMATSWAQLNST